MFDWGLPAIIVVAIGCAASLRAVAQDWPDLVEMLQAKEVGQRISGAIALSHLGDPPSGVLPAIRKSLEDQSLEVRLFVATALLRVGDLPSQNASVNILIAQLDSEYAREASEGLVHAGEAAVVPLHKAILRGDGGDAAIRAEHALGRIGEPALTTILELASKTEYGDYHPHGIEAFDFLDLDDLDRLLVEACSNANPKVRAGAAYFLSAQHVVSLKMAMPELRSLLKDQHAVVRKSALESLQRIGSDALPLAGPVAALASHPNEDVTVRQRAIGALVGLGDSADSWQTLVTLSQDDQPAIREAAIREIWKIDRLSDRTLPLLVERLKDPEVEVRLAAAESLANLGSIFGVRQSVLVLAEGLSSDDDRVRSRSATLLRRVATVAKEAAPIIAGALISKNRHLYPDLIETLGEIGYSAAKNLDVILSLGDSPDVFVRRSVATALGQLPVTDATLRMLFSYRKDIDVATRRRAAQALNQLAETEHAMLQPHTGILMEQLLDASPRVRCLTLNTLAQLGISPTDMSIELERVLDGADAFDAAEVLLVVDSLRRFRTVDERSEETVAELLVRKNQALVAIAAASISDSAASSPGLIMKLLKLTESADSLVQAEAVDALGRLGPPASSAVDRLQLLKESSELGLQLHVAAALAKILPDRGEINFLRHHADSGRTDDRLLAMALLVELNTDSSWMLSHLHELLVGSDKEAGASNYGFQRSFDSPYTRQRVVEILARVRPISPMTVTHLRRVIRDDSMVVVQAAVVALGEMGPAAAEATPELQACLFNPILQAAARKALLSISPVN